MNSPNFSTFQELSVEQSSQNHNFNLHNASAFPTIGKNEPQVCGMTQNGSIPPFKICKPDGLTNDEISPVAYAHRAFFLLELQK